MLTDFREATILSQFQLGVAAKIIRQLLFAFIRQELRAGHFHWTEQSISDRRIRQTTEFLQKNLSSNLAVADAAAKANLKEARFRELFRRELGISPGAYLLRLRLNQSVEMLLSEKYPMTEIANACGFSSPGYFCTVFHRAFGCPPGEYRKMLHGIS